MRQPWKRMALKRAAYTRPPRLMRDAVESRRAWGVGFEGRAWARLEHPLVQILVEVATIRVRPSKTEVEKGSPWTAIGRGWVIPKRLPNGRNARFCLQGRRPAKGNLVKIPEPNREGRGNALWPDHVGASSGKSFLFFLTRSRAAESS